MPKSCPVCGSRKWRKDGVTGNAVCEDGHVFQVKLLPSLSVIIGLKIS